MCGLAGFVDVSCGRRAEALEAVVTQMADTLRHRGPDEGGVWADEHAGIALGFRRLSILDLSQHGRQPMHSASGRYVLVFNGEVYNHRALRQQVANAAAGAAVAFRGNSDTEVVLAAIERFGLPAALDQFVGMFALALFDRQERLLHLVRDRLGEKPLYYGWMGPTFLFGSELKALRAHPDFGGQIDRDAITPYLRRGYIPAPRSIYKHVYKLSPGTILTLRPSVAGAVPSLAPFWSAAQIAEAGAGNPWDGDVHDAVDCLDRLLRDATGQQMVADVPVGAFLSGGVDSSAVVALMQQQSRQRVKTFSIGFHEGHCNEALHAQAVARHLGTEHTELYVSASDALGVVPRLPSMYDEPFGDVAQIPVFLLSQLASQTVTVCLTGDGGDELFGGYAWYSQTGRIWNGIGWMPRALRRLSAGALSRLSVQAWDRTLKMARPVLPHRLHRYVSGDRVHKLADLMMQATGPFGVYDHLVSKWNGSADIVLGVAEAGLPLTDTRECMRRTGLPRRMMFADTVSYLPDDHLVKVDRASMASSLETRAPFLDHRVVEFSWRIPASMQVLDGTGKYLVRQVLRRYIPDPLIERPKMGFPVPIDVWLRGPLHAWAEELLDERRLRREGYFDPGPIRRKWEEHVAGGRNWQHDLWHVLMFQAWLEAR